MPVRRLLAVCAAAAAVVAGGGGGGEPGRAERAPRPAEPAPPVAREDQPACAVLHERDVARIVLRTSGRRLEEIGRPVVERMQSDETSSCGYFAGPDDDVAVKLTIDRALNPAKRYWYRMEELNQRSDNWSGPDPRLVEGVGQDRSYGGAGAFWVPSLSKLTAYRDETIVTIIFFVPGVGDRESSAAAASLARMVYRRLFGDRPPAAPKSLQDRQPRP
jgi:hypothetical protein